MSEWKYLTFSAAVYINPSVVLTRGSVYPYVDMSVINPDSQFVSEAEIRLYEGSGSRFEVGDVLMARITPCLENGKIARFYSKEHTKGFGSTEFIILRGREGITDTQYVYYLTKWEGVREYAIGQMTGTSGRQRVPTTAFDYLVVPLPPLPEQRAIARILGALDDKIELNRRMNATLEQIARALFKAWFVDFEPVRAKQDGRWRRGESLPGMPAHLYDLFPNRLVDSELGAIPEGWEVSTLGCILTELVSGGRPRGGAVDSGIPSVGAENVVGLGKYDYSKEKFIPEEFFESLKVRGADVRDGDVLLYKDGAQIGRKTYFDKGFPHAVCAVNEHVFILRTGRAWMQRYLYFWLDQDWMTNEIIALNSNSAQPGINQAGVRSLPILMPPEGVVRAFDELVAPLTGKLFWNCHQSRTLAALRDTLLPQLITGVLRVGDGVDW